MGRKMNVMQVLSQAGGLNPYASEGSIVVLRNEDGKKKSIPFPYDDVASGDFEKDVDLLPGDVIFVPTSGLF
jgi:polysaccharide export outer membrane protein